MERANPGPDDQPRAGRGEGAALKSGIVHGSAHRMVSVKCRITHKATKFPIDRRFAADIRDSSNATSQPKFSVFWDIADAGATIAQGEFSRIQIVSYAGNDSESRDNYSAQVEIRVMGSGLK